MQRVTQIVPCQWTDLGIIVQRVAHSGSAHPLDKQFLESVAHFVDDDEPLGGNAALTGIYQATLRADCGGQLEVSILENEIRIASTDRNERR